MHMGSYSWWDLWSELPDTRFFIPRREFLEICFSGVDWNCCIRVEQKRPAQNMCIRDLEHGFGRNRSQLWD